MNWGWPTPEEIEEAIEEDKRLEATPKSAAERFEQLEKMRVLGDNPWAKQDREILDQLLPDVTPEQHAANVVFRQPCASDKVETPDVGVKNDAGKPRMDLLPYPALKQIAEVFDFGTIKYDKNNWRKGMDWSRVAAAAMRHLYAWNDGEDKDPETGKSHLAHLGCCVMFLLTYEADGLGTDDRFKKPISEVA